MNPENVRTGELPAMLGSPGSRYAEFRLWLLAALMAFAVVSGAGCQATPDEIGMAEADLSRLPEGARLGERSDRSGSSISAEARRVVAEYVAPKPGTEFTWRNNWQSLPPRITYRVGEMETIAGRQYVKLTSIEGMDETTHAFYDAENFSLKGYRNRAGKILLSYNPVEERYRFPLRAGEKWVTSWQSKDYRSEKVTKGGGTVTVQAFERIELPAGTFDTVKISLPMPRQMAGMRHHIWFAPELGVTVKEQITNGRMNWTQILESVRFPE